MWSFVLSIALFSAVSNAVTLSSGSDYFSISADSSNSFYVTISRSNCDITSLKYRGTEVQSSSGGKYTHIGSGLGSASVSATTITTGGTSYVKATCDTGSLIQYYVVRDGESALHMATYVSSEPSIGELRWIGRFKQSVLPYDDVSQASDTSSSSSTVEGSDVFTVNGQTRSKFYSSRRFIDDQVHCLSGSDIKACMIMPGTAYESSSGGPFFRDINMNPSDDTSALYFYMNSGHAQTESYRMGLHGPYSCYFSRSGTPSSSFDLSFMGSMGLQGWTSSRGRVSGTAIGIDTSKYKGTVHWYNSNAQYWTYTDSSGGFTSPYMKTGSYNMVLYQDEFKVATSSISVSSGSTTSKGISSTWSLPANTIFQIGDWDGQPYGFRNADKIERMHPSDSRMSSWGPITYIAGSSSWNDFPMAIFKGYNDPVTIKFSVNSGQTGFATLRIGTTISFGGGRPGVTVNGNQLTVPGAPTSLNSRGVTRGTYRGFGDVYDYSISGLTSGSNTITIFVASGSSGSTFLAPSIVFDFVHLWSSSGNSGSTTAKAASTSTARVTTTQGSDTSSRTTQQASTTSSSSDGTPNGLWGQCGGNSWTGSTNCVSGATCQFSNEWYSQCVPA